MAVISSEQYMSFLVPCVPICRLFSRNVILWLASPMSPKRPLFAYRNVKMLSKAPQAQVLFAFIESTIHIIRNGDHNLEILNSESDHIILHNWAHFQVTHVIQEQTSDTQHLTPHGMRICIKRKKIHYGKFFDFCAEKCVYN